MENSWICVFCQQRSHYKGMGDLFGPYYIPLEIKNQPQLSQQQQQLTIINDYKIEDHIKQEGSSSSTTTIDSNQLRSRLTYEKRRLPEGFSSGDSPDSKRRLIDAKNNLEVIDSIQSTINRVSSNSNGDNNPSPPPQPQQQQQREVWFHEDCLIWTNGVYLVGHRIKNIEEVIKDCSENICCECKLKGAPLGCLRKGCSPRYHYLCAKEKGCHMDEGNFSIHCPKHKVSSNGKSKLML